MSSSVRVASTVRVRLPMQARSSSTRSRVGTTIVTSWSLADADHCTRGARPGARAASSVTIETGRLARNARWLCASPAYLREHAAPHVPSDLARHRILGLRENDEDATLWHLERDGTTETVRLKALTDKDRGEIDAQQREITQLRETLARQSATAAAAASGKNADLEAKLKERENSVTRLMGTIKEHETTIKKLTEASDSWKRKYQFLATDQPDAYKSTAEK